MTATDPTAPELHRALSFAAPDDRETLTRRRFLMAAGAGAGLASLPTWMTDLAAASSSSRGSGTIVLVVLDGGNDGLHMVPPVEDGRYHDARGLLAFDPSSSLPLPGGRGFHPALTRLKARFDTGQVAIVDGVGNPRRDLSHFSSMADFEHGGPAATFSRTGWLGRYLDDAGTGDFGAIAVGSRVPLVVRGERRSAITLPVSADQVPARREWAVPLDRALGQWTTSPTGHGALADRVAAATAGMLTTADSLRPWYRGSGGSPLAVELRLCANLLNADLGTRVLTVRHGPYDSHTGQEAMYDRRMAELDEAIETFFTTLDPVAASDVTLLCVSEFGRRVAGNGGGGTEHGAGNSVLAVGPQVIGGFHGSLPSLSALTADGNLTHDIDYRSVFATVLDGVLGVDPSSILAGTFAPVPFLADTAGRAPTGRGRTGTRVPRPRDVETDGSMRARNGSGWSAARAGQRAGTRVRSIG